MKTKLNGEIGTCSVTMDFIDSIIESQRAYEMMFNTILDKRKMAISPPISMTGWETKNSMPPEEEKIQREKIALMKLAMLCAFIWGTIVIALLTLIAFHGK